jgi:heptosyltransferase-3
MRILLIQLRQLGDILLTTPCIRAVRQAMPEAEIDFCSHPMGKLILSRNPHINKLIPYYFGNSPNEHWRYLRELRQRNYDIVVDFMNNPRSALISYASGAETRVGFLSSRSLAYNLVIAKPSDNQYIVRKKFALLQPLGIDAQDLSLVFPCESSKLIDDFLRPIRENYQKTIVFSPTHRREVRQWPLENYARLAKELQAKHQAAVIWLWGPGEREMIEACQKLASGAGFIAPETDLHELGYLIGQAQLFIGNSNGPSHLAVAANTPSIQLHGPTKGVAWCPDSERHQFLQSRTGHMSDISWEGVLELAKRLLSDA